MIRMNRSWRIAAAATAAALSLAACGSDDGDTKSGGSGGDCKEQNLAFLGATTGDAGALGLNMVYGIQTALDEYNKDADCKVELKQFDSQGNPEKAPALATQIVNDDTIIGLIGPGFSGESLATG
jgi:branched-chain amino acid transport system substrate-binding protein